MRFRSLLVLLSAVGLFTLGFLAPWTPKAVADGDRLGCTYYCQNAGGYGAPGPGPQGPPAVTLENTGTAVADADGYVPVTLKCHRTVQCLGKFWLFLENVRVGGRSDLLVNAGATRTIGVPFDAASIAYLRSHGPTLFGLGIDASAEALNRGDHRASSDGFAVLITFENALTVAAPG
jgi:hypothetical protein